MPFRSCLTWVGLTLLAGCSSSGDPNGDPRDRTVGAWYLSSCSTVAVDNPRQTAPCGPGHATRLDVNAEYRFVTTPLPPDADSLSSLRGYFDLQHGQIQLAYDRLPPSGSVVVLAPGQVMTWSATSDVRFSGEDAVKPAVVTIIWARDP